MLVNLGKLVVFVLRRMLAAAVVGGMVWAGIFGFSELISLLIVENTTFEVSPLNLRFLLTIAFIALCLRLTFANEWGRRKILKEMDPEIPEERIARFEQARFDGNIVLVLVFFPALPVIVQWSYEVAGIKGLFLGQGPSESIDYLLFTLDIFARGFFFDAMESYGLQIGDLRHNPNNLLIASLVFLFRTAVGWLLLTSIVGSMTNSTRSYNVFPQQS